MVRRRFMILIIRRPSWRRNISTTQTIILLLSYNLVAILLRAQAVRLRIPLSERFRAFLVVIILVARTVARVLAVVLVMTRLTSILFMILVPLILVMIAPINCITEFLRLTPERILNRITYPLQPVTLLRNTLSFTTKHRRGNAPPRDPPRNPVFRTETN